MPKADEAAKSGHLQRSGQKSLFHAVIPLFGGFHCRYTSYMKHPVLEHKINNGIIYTKEIYTPKGMALLTSKAIQEALVCTPLAVVLACNDPSLVLLPCRSQCFDHMLPTHASTALIPRLDQLNLLVLCIAGCGQNAIHGVRVHGQFCSKELEV